MKLTGILGVVVLYLHSAVGEYKRVCYYTNWSQYRSGVGKFFPEDIDPFLCTHIMYAFGKLENNKITNFEWNDPDTDWSKGLYSRVNALKEANPKLKVLLAMGGWNAGSVIYSNMVATEATRRTFIDSAITFLRDIKFDGLDMDWEYPAQRGGAATDYDNFASLIMELRLAFEQEASSSGEERLLLTAAVAAGKSNIDAGYNVPVMATYMDFICIMTYDINGAWSSTTGHNSPLSASAADTDKTFNMKWATEYWHYLGVPKDKLIIGLATYGRAFTLADPSNYGVGAPAKTPAPSGPYTREAGFFSYYEICEKQQSGAGTTYRDPDAGVPYYVEGNIWVGFDDETSLYNKAKNLIVAGGYGGAMVWALPLDDFKGQKCGSRQYPLINTIKDVLVAAETGSTAQPPPSTAAPPTGTNAPGSTAAPPTSTNAPGSTAAPPTGTNAPGSTAAPPTGTNAPGSTAGPTPAPTTQSPGGTGFCADKANGLYGDPTDCSAYYNCWHGVGVQQKCAGNLLWNQYVKGCDYEWRVTCDVSGSTSAAPGTAAPSTAAPSTAAPSTAAPTTTAPSSSAPSTSAPGTPGPSTAAPTTKQPSTTGPNAVGEYKRVCYYTNWSQYRSGLGKFFPEDIDPFLCTHIMYAFGKLENNKITNFEWNDPDTDWSKGLYSRVNALKETNPKLKVLLAMGGWNAGSVIYSNMAATEATRRTFIDSAITFLRDIKFDGLDMDWEYPAQRGGAAADYDNFALLITELRMAFDDEASRTGNDRLLLTAAVAAGKSNIDPGYNVNVMATYMDFICIMTYDFNGAWSSTTGHNSPLSASAADTDKTFNMKWAAEYWNEIGAPKDKLIIGLATYGRAFTLADPSNYGVGAPAKTPAPSGPYTREAGFFSYYEICEKQQSGAGTTYRDPDAGVPYYVEGNIWVGFDDERSLYEKTQNLIVAGGYGGAMVWALPLDDFKGQKCGSRQYPLINTIKDVLVAAETGSTAQPPRSTAAPPTGTNATGSTAAPPTGTNAPGSTAGPTPAPTTQSPGGTGFCADKANGLYGDPTDCSAYYNCWYGVGVQQKCADNLLWNQDVKGCDYEWRVTCDVSGSTSAAPSTAAPSTAAPSTAAPSTAAPSTGQPTTPGPTTDCSELADGYYSYPGDCTKFIQCHMGTTYVKSCANGLHFNVAVNGCDWPANAGCATKK